MLTLLMSTLMMSTPALAEEPSVTEILADATKSALNVEVMVIHATTEHTKKDESIKHLLKYFANYKYTGYKLLKEHKSELNDKQDQSFTLPGELKMKVSILSHNDKQAKVLVKITDVKGTHNYLDSTITVPRNNNFMVAGPKYDGGILILPLSVKY
ncbi:MAG: hypothetical protein CL916_10955 [Deltaproteobacteria bacterium]|nr:hypothetical protein [Deltaproteobacteria bacterium]